MKQIIMNEFKSYIRNPFIIAVLLFFPLIMIFILGNLVETAQTADPAIGTVIIGYTSDSIDLEHSNTNASIKFMPLSQTEGPLKLAEEEIDGYLDLSNEEYKIYEGPSIIINNVLKSIANGMLLHKDAATVIAQNTGSLSNLTINKSEYTIKRDLDVNMSMFDYYVIAMTIMTGVFSSLAASMTFTQERNNRTMNRLITSPMNKAKIFFAKCLGQIPFAVLQVSLILVFSSIAYGTRYASSFWGNVLLFLMLVMTGVVSDIIGVVISLVCRRSMAVAIFIGGWVLLLFSGIFAKMLAIEPFCNYLAPYLIRCAAFDLTLFGNYSPALSILLTECLLSILLIMAGGFIFGKKQEERV